MSDTKRCPRCERTLPLDSFAVSAKNVRQTYCRSCNSAYVAEWMRNNEGRRAANRLWTYYRLRREDWEAMWDRQNGQCALCRMGLDETKMVVDHDHRCCPGERSCGRCVRAILCRRCNTAVGWLECQPNYSLESFVGRVMQYVDDRAERVTDLNVEVATRRRRAS